VLKNRTLSILLLAVVVVFDVVYFMTHRDDFQLLTRFSIEAVAALVLLEVLMIFCVGVQVKLLTDHYGLGLTFWQWFGLARMTSLTNLMFGFAAGTSVKAVYLKRFHNLKYGSFIAATGIAAIIKFLLGALLASGLLIAMGQAGTFLFATAVGIFGCTLVFFIFGHMIPQKYFRWWGPLHGLVEEWQSIRRNHKLVMQMALLSLLVFALYTFEIYLAFVAFGISAPFSVSAIISAFDSFAGALKLIPGNFGIKEAIFAAISAVYGIGVNEGVHAAVLHRVVRTVVSLVSGSGFVYQFVRWGTISSAAPVSEPVAGRAPRLP
jgi:uncharacterized membrane protein YbhN (UPF0104 family)